MAQKTIASYTQILKALRALYGYSQTDVADRLGINYNTYAEKEASKKEFTLSEIVALLELYGLKFEDIFLQTNYKKLVVKSVKEISGTNGHGFEVDIEGV